ncbi:MAG: hypothetical protein ABFD69_09585 [Candidatus Sumerlaeia bacterium]
MKRGLMLIVGLMLAAGVCQAQVSSKAVTVTPSRGVPTQITLDLVSSTAVAGIQGQINYDSTIFSNPKVEGGLGASGFIIMGNLVTPGQYRFIVYANPTKSLQTAYTVLQFTFDTASVLPIGGSKTITYTIEAASTTGGSSISSVNFADVTVLFKRNSADNWSIYR